MSDQGWCFCRNTNSWWSDFVFTEKFPSRAKAHGAVRCKVQNGMNYKLPEMVLWYCRVQLHDGTNAPVGAVADHVVEG